jgi:hypothetical protein
MVLLLADGALGDLADASNAWRPLLGAGVAALGIRAIWEIARTRRIVAGPAGVHWAGGLSPSAGAVRWGSVWRIDSLIGRFGTQWRVDVLSGPAADPRLITLRGPGRWAELRLRTPEPIAEWWRQAGDEVEVQRHSWGWRVEAERELPPRPLFPVSFGGLLRR